MAASIEQSHDENGIIWPMALAPYQVIITPVNVNEEEVMKSAEGIYKSMLDDNIEVIFDDRDERAGVKFKDADLIGVPLRVVVGQKNLVHGKVELKIRKTGENKLYALEEIVQQVKQIIDQELQYSE
ncbi:Prolyl-tRNA synthetase, bacterial type [Smithella sp. ME-1]|nr:Prolyl-tRNA synthetase, bacterial type [Smithella sp. ME-1]